MDSDSDVPPPTQTERPAECDVPANLSDTQREAYIKLLQYRPAEGTPIRQVVMYGDFAKDFDDTLAIIILIQLHRLGFIRVCGIIANIKPADYRARIARGLLDSFGLDDIPVGQGTDGLSDTSVEDETFVNEIKSQYEKQGERLEARDSHARARIEEGSTLIKRLCEEAKSQGTKLTLVLTTSLRDLAEFITEHEDLYADAVGTHLIQGGYRTYCGCEAGMVLSTNGTDRVIEGGDIKFDQTDIQFAMNNKYDGPSAELVHRSMQEHKKRSSVFTKWVAFEITLPHDTFDIAAKGEHKAAIYLRDVQMMQEENFYKNSLLASAKAGSSQRDSNWYLNGRTTWNSLSDKKRYEILTGLQWEDADPTERTKVLEEQLPEFEMLKPLVKVVVYDAFPALSVLGRKLLRKVDVLEEKSGGSGIHKVYGTKVQEGQTTRNDTSGMRKEETASLLAALFQSAFWDPTKPSVGESGDDKSAKESR